MPKGAKPTPRILIHAGFHKTGTTSVQRTLRANRPVLKSRFVIALPWKLKPLLHAARGYSTYGDPLSLAKFTHRAETLVADLPPLTRRDLILCSEELSGHLPGRGGLRDYRAAPVLMGELVRALLQRFPNASILVVYSTRAPQAWLTSAYWEQVKSSRQTLSLDDYVTQFAKAADFAPILTQVAQAIAPADLDMFSLEDTAHHRLGPASAVLRLAGLSQADLAALTPVPAANTRLPQPVLDHLLQLNRTHADDSPARIAAKEAFLNGLSSASDGG